MPPGPSAAVREKAAATHRAKRAARMSLAETEACAEWVALRERPDFMFGLALYIGEGDKTMNSLALINTDVDVLRAALRFYRLVGVAHGTVRARIFLHEGREEGAAVAYWAGALGIAPDRFSKTSWKKSGGLRRAVHPWGLCCVQAHNAHLKRKVRIWMRLALAAE